MRQFITDFINNNLVLVLALSIILFILSFNSRIVRKFVIGSLCFGLVAILVYELYKIQIVNEKSYLFLCEMIVIILVTFENISHVFIEMSRHFGCDCNHLIVFSLIYYSFIISSLIEDIDLSVFTVLIYCAFIYTLNKFRMINKFLNTKINNIKNISVNNIVLRC